MRDLAVAMGRDVDHVFECLLFIDTTGKGIDNENSPLSVQVAGEVCVKSGVRAQTIAQPAALRELEGLLAIANDIYTKSEFKLSQLIIISPCNKIVCSLLCVA